jgi:hypothetical protein
VTHFITVLVLALAVLPATAAPLSGGERDRAMSYLHATRKQFIDVVTSVSDAQWNYQPAAGRWSLAQIAEHIALSEDKLFQFVEQMLKAPPKEGAKSAVTDEKVMTAMADRSFKAQAPEFLKPAGQWMTRDELLADFKKWRDRTIDFLENTQTDLRSRTVQHPMFGMIDAYQWCLMIPSHTERHLQQMREVIASPGYPKK